MAGVLLLTWGRYLPFLTSQISSSMTSISLISSISLLYFSIKQMAWDWCSWKNITIVISFFFSYLKENGFSVKREGEAGLSLVSCPSHWLARWKLITGLSSVMPPWAHTTHNISSYIWLVLRLCCVVFCCVGWYNIQASRGSLLCLGTGVVGYDLAIPRCLHPSTWTK